MEPLLGLAIQAGAQVADLQVNAGWPNQIVHLEPSQDVGYEALKLFEVRAPGVWLRVLELHTSASCLHPGALLVPRQ
jgi:hypothetical protein